MNDRHKQAVLSAVEKALDDTDTPRRADTYFFTINVVVNCPSGCGSYVEYECGSVNTDQNCCVIKFGQLAEEP